MTDRPPSIRASPRARPARPSQALVTTIHAFSSPPSRHSRCRRSRSRRADCRGTYKTSIKSPAELKGTWSLALAKGGTYTVTWNGQRLARGSYSSTSTTITLMRERGSGCTGTGTYGWKRSGKTVTFVRKRESSSCQARAAVLAHRFTQVG